MVGLKLKYFWFCEDANCAPNGVDADNQVVVPPGVLGLRLLVAIVAAGNPAAPGIERLLVHDGFAPTGVVKSA